MCASIGSNGAAAAVRQQEQHMSTRSFLLVAVVEEEEEVKEEGGGGGLGSSEGQTRVKEGALQCLDGPGGVGGAWRGSVGWTWGVELFT